MKVFLIVLGCLVALLGGACGAVGAAFLTVVGTDGYIESGWEHVNVESSALVSGRQQVDRLRGLAHGADSGADVTIRVRAESRNPDKEVFIGIAPREPLLDYAKNARLDLVYNISLDPTRVQTIPADGDRELAAPTRQSFWLASVAGPAEQELLWTPASDDERIFIMNADGSPGLDVDVSVGMKVEELLPASILLVVVGLIGVGVGILLIVVGARRKKSPPPAHLPLMPPPPPPPPPPVSPTA